MAAGLGFKDFTTGEVLTAADVDGYLMQGIWVFASAAARDAAVTSPQEGNACYLKDTNEVLTYSGSAWVAVGGSVATSLGYTAGKNVLLNGAFDIWQRGTTSSGNAYIADRWYSALISGTGTFAQETTVVPTGSTNSMKFTASATAQPALYQAIETPNAIRYAGQTVTVSAQVAASTSTGFTIDVQHSASTNNSVTGTWTSITATSGGTATATSTTFVSISGVYAIPSTAKSLRVRLFTTSTIANAVVVYFDNIQLEAGSSATTFQTATASIGAELIECQRYFTKSYNQTVVPGTGDTAGKIRTYSGAESTGALGITVYIPPMRVAPTITSYDDLGASGKCFKGGNGATATIGSVSNNAVEVVCLDATNTREFYFYFTASAEL